MSAKIPIAWNDHHFRPRIRVKKGRQAAKRKMLTLLALGAVAIGAANTWAAIPVSGRPVPELEKFDELMVDFMDDNAIEAGVLGIMKDGKIVYLRGFGYAYNGMTSLPENTLFRIASCSKPITVASVRQRIAAGQFSLTSKAFDVGQVGGGLLDATPGGRYEPFPRPSEDEDLLEKVTVQHLISHLGGWDRNPPTDDLTYNELGIAGDMAVTSPPGRTNTVRWILGQPLQYTPGTIPPTSVDRYSNIGCLVLGLVVEQFSEMDMISYVRKKVLTPEMWIPSTEIQQGRTFRLCQDPREPLYASDERDTSVFWPYWEVSCPYGSWDHEARIGQGGYIAGAATMLEFLDRYHVGTYSTDIGQPINSTFPLLAEEAHNGSLEGVNTYMVQRTDGVNVFVAFNEDWDDGNYAVEFYDAKLDQVLDSGGLAWPARTSDGFWIAPELTGTGVGGYDQPFHGVANALDYVADGSKLRLKAGSSSWTGTIAKRVLVDAPLGTAVIGPP